MSRLAVLNVVGLCDRHLGEQMPNLQAYAQAHGKATIKPVLPALTCSAQATYLTGKLPTETGIVANGWYDRELAENHFWKQSNHLVQAPKLWELVRESKPDFTVAKLFWWYNMYADVNWSITPRPMYPADGRKVFDIYTYPMELREQIKGDLGEFPFPAFWGPMAGLPSSAWIADSARWIEEQQQPDLSLVYLPHLDYNLQRLGPHDPAVAEDLRAIDGLVGELLRFYEQRGVQVVVLSEYGISEVSRSVALNRLFRQQGWLTIKPELGRELLDCGASAAFAIADHQIAHVYVNDPAIEGEVRELLASTPGVAQVLSGEAKRTAGLNHHRAGNLIAVAEEDTVIPVLLQTWVYQMVNQEEQAVVAWSSWLLHSWLRYLSIVGQPSQFLMELQVLLEAPLAVS